MAGRIPNKGNSLGFLGEPILLPPVFDDKHKPSRRDNWNRQILYFCPKEAGRQALTDEFQGISQ